MNIQEAINAVAENRDLSPEQMSTVMNQIMTGNATPAQIGGFLIGLRMKGETVEEVAAAASVMRDLALRVQVGMDNLVDVVGTGGDASGTFNISTASALVAAAAGVKVAKHGNRSVSSKSGAADLLEAAGVNLELSPEQVAQCIETVGVGFMFAPRHHSAMKHAVGPRRELAARTIFNVLGPLTNPAGAANQVLGVFSKQWVEPLAQVLARLGSRHVMVVHGEDGLDEISVCASTQVAELRDGEVKSHSIAPEDFGFERADPADLRVDNAEQSLAVIRHVLDNQPGAPRDIVALNAGAAIYVAGLANNHQIGVAKALEAIASGGAKHTLQQLVDFTMGMK